MQTMLAFRCVSGVALRCLVLSTTVVLVRLGLLLCLWSGDRRMFTDVVRTIGWFPFRRGLELAGRSRVWHCKLPLAVCGALMVAEDGSRTGCGLEACRPEAGVAFSGVDRQEVGVSPPNPGVPSPVVKGDIVWRTLSICG